MTEPMYGQESFEQMTMFWKGLQFMLRCNMASMVQNCWVTALKMHSVSTVGQNELFWKIRHFISKWCNSRYCVFVFAYLCICVWSEVSETRPEISEIQF